MLHDNSPNPHPGSRLNRLALNAEDEAKGLKDDFVAVEHVLLTLLDDTGTAGRRLKDPGLSRDRPLAALHEVGGSRRPAAGAGAGRARRGG